MDIWNRVVILILLACTVWPASVSAETPKKKTRSGVITQSDRDATSRSYLFFDFHGYFRFRSDLFWRVDLGTRDSSRYTLPLSENAKNRHRGAKTLHSSNIRFRFEPTLHVGEDFRIYGQFDILDNLVLGSTPSFHPGSGINPLAFFNEAQAPPSDGSNSWRDGIRIKRLWGEWHLFGMFTLRGGRRPHHFGLGMLHNSGNHWDADFGNSVDGFEIEVVVPHNVRLAVSWDYFSEGAISTLGTDYFGQGHDLDQLDDFNQWTFKVFMKPVTAKDWELRRAKLANVGWRSFVIDWSVYNIFRTQPLSTDRQSTTLPSICRTTSSNTLGVTYDCWALSARDAFFWVPNAWVKMQMSPARGHYLRMEFEFAYIFGNISVTQVLGSTDSRKRMRQFGGVGQFEWRYKRWRVQLEVGFASGDDAEFFGITDGQNLVSNPDSDFSNNATVRNNSSILNFKFNRDYHVDLILFREIIGAVTNAVYLKPSFDYLILNRDAHKLGFNFSAVWARALKSGATPGNVPDLGLELDFRLYYHFGKHIVARLESGVFFPGKGFRNLNLNINPSVAFTMQTQLVWQF